MPSGKFVLYSAVIAAATYVALQHYQARGGVGLGGSGRARMGS